jgi:hypothetical protein
MKAQDEFYRAYAAKVGQEFSRQAKGFQAVFAQDPRMGQALEASAKEMRKLDGVPLRTTTYVVGVPLGLKFDRELVLAGAKAQAEAPAKKAGGGIFGKLKQAAEQAAQQQKGQEQGEQKTEPKQGTLMTVIDETREISTGPVSADKFTIPAGYKERKPEMPK